MNILEILAGITGVTGILPISSGVLSLATALSSYLITKRDIEKTENLENLSKKITDIKINDHEIKLEGVDEKEIIELLEKLNTKKKVKFRRCGNRIFDNEMKR